MHRRAVVRVTGYVLTGALLMGSPVSAVYGAPVAGVSAATPGTETVDSSGAGTGSGRKGTDASGTDTAAKETADGTGTEAKTGADTAAKETADKTGTEAKTGADTAAKETADKTGTDTSAKDGIGSEDSTSGSGQEGLAAGISQAVSSTLAGSQEESTKAGKESPMAGISQTVSEAMVAGSAAEEGQVSENDAPTVESEYADIAIAQVDNYVNVRSEPSTESEVLGKLYDNSAATVLETTDNGWYKITSGKVTGYVKCEYVVTGDEELAKAVSTRYADVTTTTLFVRSEPTTESSVLTMVPLGDDLVVLDESLEGWALVTTEAGDGYVSKDYVSMRTEFVQAESKEEEEARLAKEEQERQAAAAAAEAARKSSGSQAGSKSSGSGSSSGSGGQSTYSAPASSNGQAVANYACQFVGNPYVYGGTSLTNGADCSGFVMSVYAAFGISLPHSSSAMRSCGYEVSLSDAQPGDIVCYSGHVGIYVGGGTIVNASTPSSGIKYSSVSYRTPICVRRIF